MELRGKHLLVTGAAKRVGRSIVDLLRTKGVRVTAHYHTSKNDIDDLVAQSPTDIHAVAADLRSVEQTRALASAAEAKFGPVDILVNSASDFFSTRADAVTEDQWDCLMDLNVKGQFFLAQAIERQMRGRGGVIVNIADVNGERPIKNYAPYVASKGALLTLTKALAKEWAPHIRVCSVSPGAVLLPETYTQEQIERAISRSLLKRVGSAEDVAAAVQFLIENDYITGFDLKVDGGRSLG